MRRSLKQRLGLTVLFSLAVLFVFLVTALIIVLISFISVRLGIVSFETRGRFVVILIFVLASVIVGTIVSLVFGHVPLKPVRAIIAATNQLAAGDFSARLQISHPVEFCEVAESFNKMAEELGGLEMLRTDFVNNFSHEFKTPIVSIKGFAEMLKYGDLTEEEEDEYLSIIISESERLASLATNVLNLSKIENQKILSETHRYNLAEQVRRCILMLETKWEKKDITFSLDIDEIMFTANEELLSQVWINLLDNAIKFTPNGGEISICLKARAEQLYFSIRDNGCGLAEEAARHIFDKFYQADPARSGLGNGLGLTLVKKIIELHGGTIVCSSEQEGGTEFVIQLPVRQ